MIIDILYDQIDKMDSIIKYQTMKDNADKQKQNLLDLENITTKIYEHVQMLNYAKNDLSFSTSFELSMKIHKIIVNTQNCVHNGLIYEDQLDECKNELKQITKEIEAEWMIHFKLNYSKVIGTLNAVINTNRIVIQKCIDEIQEGRPWKDLNSLKTMQKGLLSAESIIDNLDLSNEIIGFLQKIKFGTATVADLNPRILEWIEKENLQNKIGLRM